MTMINDENNPLDSKINTKLNQQQKYDIKKILMMRPRPCVIGNKPTDNKITTKPEQGQSQNKEVVWSLD